MLPIALSLPAPDIEALIQGRTIAAMPKLFLQPGRTFALYPANTLLNLLPPEQSYRSGFMPTVRRVLSRVNSDTVWLKAWAKCERCQLINNPKWLEDLSNLTVWTTEAFQQSLQERPNIFLAYLRVYRLLQPIEISSNTDAEKNLGMFIGLSGTPEISKSEPVLSDRIFSQRCHQLENRLPPEHPELEDLQGILAQYAISSPAANAFDRDIRAFLGWSEQTTQEALNLNLDWISKIAEVGNSSDGNEFEKLVRKSFIELGFSNSEIKTDLKNCLNPETTGGAGGLDLYCDTPYQVVGECKATKTEKVPDGTPAQLVKLGQKFLDKTEYESCIKIILAAGELTKAANKTAKGNHMNVLRPETLQRLVELKTQYPGSIDLFALKLCLEQEPFGEDADFKVNQYIENILEQIKMRAHILKAVKELSEQDNGSLENHAKHFTVTEIRAHYNATHNPKLNDKQVNDLLVELSSPLAGYLGRIKGENWQGNRFYFLRELSDIPPSLMVGKDDR